MTIKENRQLTCRKTYLHNKISTELCGDYEKIEMILELLILLGDVCYSLFLDAICKTMNLEQFFFKTHYQCYFWNICF